MRMHNRLKTDFNRVVLKVKTESLLLTDTMLSTAEYFNTTFHLFFRVAVVGQKFESISNEVEHWYGTKYRLEKIPDVVLDVSFLTVIFCRTYIYWPLTVFLISDICYILLSANLSDSFVYCIFI
jgi:ABC-type transport system involved in Fe-S cluster assembly fused permease/ATPase subunit